MILMLLFISISGMFSFSIPPNVFFYKTYDAKYFYSHFWKGVFYVSNLIYFFICKLFLSLKKTFCIDNSIWALNVFFWKDSWQILFLENKNFNCMLEFRFFVTLFFTLWPWATISNEILVFFFQTILSPVSIY